MQTPFSFRSVVRVQERLKVDIIWLMPFPMLSTVHHAIGTRDLLIADRTSVLISHSVAKSNLGKLCAQISELEDENIIV